ncbi:MAG: hypothetical protein COV74_02615 [Candidatus Omnitrophica bacterium CG11_big_fil_rev_8_21_14_0_20_45_26]|uniref:DUF5683 domain-containing protein n=1 Tax=Candidatus Abzuiibacterium crystallinum TaxID=1974748 RepID=A0A2H0LRE9_9BACT|nr:MAG: hypothetical protein COV74_02615 [Candidatus Omnitrophica bacterium CG11_big_fil_rev_8_21_14_0_20_45_26]PIW65584.1 MAG: hypothetical protein COW12_01305 [Candidatus Omnitrophica bacterium CG12_big_fil_rev_8_21_14_0_65_45_16]
MSKKIMAMALVLVMAFSAAMPQAMAVNTAEHGKITGKSVVHGLASLVIWPGLGQYLNDNETKKNWTHAILGITQIFRLWSGWDAMIDRTGGRWDGKI